MAEPLTDARLDEIEAREKAATTGPWTWRGDVDNWHIRLSGTREIVDRDGYRRRMRTTVVDFTRWGMRNARPRFNVDDLMHDGEEFAVYEVARTATSRKDPRVYRGDIVDLRHPDAQFIEHAREDVPALLVEVRRLREENARLVAGREPACG